MGEIYELLSADNEVFRAYIFWTTILIIKMFLMVVLTARARFSTKVRNV